MPYNGSGVFSRVYSWATEALSPPIEVAKLDTQETDFATGLSNCVLRDGTGVPTAATPWNSQNLTGVGNLTSTTATIGTLTLTNPLAVLQGGTGATTASAARTNLGLVIGTDVPGPTGTGASGTWGISISGNALTATSATSATTASSATTATSATTAGTITSQGTLATKSSVNNSDWSGTDLAVANGGTGASDAATALTNLGIGSMATRAATIGTGDASGGADGDVHFKYTP